MGIFQPATKTQSYLRLGFSGVAGGGKTWSSLALATALGGRIAVIDTERGSASKYAHRFSFSVLNMPPPYSPDHFIRLINAAVSEGFDTIIIDSLSHEWMGTGGALEMVDAASKSKTGGNSHYAWGSVTPHHNRLLDCIIAARAHVIVTTRAKGEYLEGQQRDGRKTYTKVGMQPIQRDGLDFEFDVWGQMNEGTYTVEKTRCELLTGRTFYHPGEELATILKDWLSDGAPMAEPVPQPAPQSDPTPAPAPTRSTDITPTTRTVTTSTPAPQPAPTPAILPPTEQPAEQPAAKVTPAPATPLPAPTAASDAQDQAIDIDLGQKLAELDQLKPTPRRKGYDDLLAELLKFLEDHDAADVAKRIRPVGNVGFVALRQAIIDANDYVMAIELSAA